MLEGADPQTDDVLVEMAYRWGDIERALPSWYRGEGEARREIGQDLAAAVGRAFRVEAFSDAGIDEWGHEWVNYWYTLLFDVADIDARQAANLCRAEEHKVLSKAITGQWPGEGKPVVIRVCSKGTPAEGIICGRALADPPQRHIDVTDVPVEKPNSNVALVQRDKYWLTPIEVPFYDALRETGLVFAVQPWIQGVETRFRLDFLVFYDGGMVAVELDGHESHKTKEQRTRDARRDRWFAARNVRTLRWTGSEVHANAQECVRQLLEILRGTPARP